MTIRKGRKIIAGNGAAAIASTQNPGLVQPDGKTILIDEAGIISSLGGGSSFNIDDQTITLNEEENIQVVGTKTLDGSFKNDWIGTKAEYDKAVESGIITEETVCIITDDEDINVDHCVVCGKIIPEGRQVCAMCEARYEKEA